MECCSPDVGDCQKCHPELWIQKGGSYCNWIPKGTIPFDPRLRIKSNRGSKGMAKPSPFNRTRSKPARRQGLTRKKRTG